MFCTPEKEIRRNGNIIMHKDNTLSVLPVLPAAWNSMHSISQHKSPSLEVMKKNLTSGKWLLDRNVTCISVFRQWYLLEGSNHFFLSKILT